MDILDDIADHIATSIGEDVFTPDRREDFLRVMRTKYGKDRHYIASLSATQALRRERRVLMLFKAQLSSREISEREGISQRRVNQIIARNPLP